MGQSTQTSIIKLLLLHLEQSVNAAIHFSFSQLWGGGRVGQQPENTVKII